MRPLLYLAPVLLPLLVPIFTFLTVVWKRFQLHLNFPSIPARGSAWNLWWDEHVGNPFNNPQAQLDAGMMAAIFLATLVVVVPLLVVWRRAPTDAPPPPSTKH
jgi:hypothetical protein